MTWQDKQEIRRANPNKYTDRDMCVIKKESWPKASFEKTRQASDDKRSMRWQDKQEIPRGNPDKYTDRDMCVIKKESWPKDSCEKTIQT